MDALMDERWWRDLGDTNTHIQPCDPTAEMMMIIWWWIRIEILPSAKRSSAKCLYELGSRRKSHVAPWSLYILRDSTPYSSRLDYLFLIVGRTHTAICIPFLRLLYKYCSLYLFFGSHAHSRIKGVARRRGDHRGPRRSAATETNVQKIRDWSRRRCIQLGPRT